MINSIYNFLVKPKSNPFFSITEENFGYNQSERCVEIPWGLSCYNGEKRVLDIGYANAEENYIKTLLALNIPELYGFDMAAKEISGIRSFQGDIRKTTFDNDYFDLIFCISTIEHIGKDNSLYFSGGFKQSDGDHTAIAEISRILKKNGKLILTVPYGKSYDYGWFIHYDFNRWQKLIKSSKLKNIYEDYFMYKDGWIKVDAKELSDTLYKDNDAPHAAGLACVMLKK